MIQNALESIRSRSLIFPAILFLLFTIILPCSASNLLENGDFSRVKEGIPTDWGLWPGAKSAKDAADGKICLQISSDEVQYSMANQYVPIDGRVVQKVRFQGKLRCKNVRKGADSYDTVRAFIVWLDGKGKQIDNYQDTGFWAGTMGWRKFDKEFSVPIQTRRAQILLGLHECSGACDFADLKLEVTAGKLDFQPQDSGKTDTKGWWPYIAAEVPTDKSPIDVSYLLDKPAGKHGFLTAHDGHLFFQDGTRARFWGFDIMGGECFPDHKTAEKLANRLARMGVNILRLHHMDAPWAEPNIFDPAFDDTRHFSEESLDRLDYFAAQLKKKGIYIYLDWLVNRKFKKGDGVADFQQIGDGAKIVAHFDRRMIELQKEYMSMLLNHQNKYTGLKWADDPQIALSEVINEDSLFYENWYYKVPPRYLGELKKLCRTYEPKADPSRHPFDAPTLKALYRIESNYYREMRDYLRSLGLRCPTTGSNHWEDLGTGLLCDSETDYVDRHYYWDHPKVNFGWQQEFDNQPMLVSRDETLPSEIGVTRIAGKPMVITEWCFCWINDHIAEGPLIGASTACLQDWDAMIWFDISSTSPKEAMENEFDIANKPHLFSQWAAAALMFHRRDVAPLNDVEQGTISKNDLLAGKHFSSVLDGSSAVTKRVEVRISDDKSPAESQPQTAPSTLKQVNWDKDQGILTVRSSRTMAVDGFFGGKVQNFGWVTIKLDNDFAVVWLSSLDGKPLKDSKRFLVTAAARAVNTGMVFNAGRTHLESPGKRPILIEPVTAEINFADEVTFKPLGQNGTPGRERKGHTIKLGKDSTFWYEVTRD